MLRQKFKSYRVMSCSSVSVIDEAIATEALSERCRPSILRKHAALAKKNIDLVQAFVNKHSDVCEWTVSNLMNFVVNNWPAAFADLLKARPANIE